MCIDIAYIIGIIIMEINTTSTNYMPTFHHRKSHQDRRNPRLAA